MPFDGIVTRAATTELESTVLPGKINKIYQPTENEIILTIRGNGKNQTLLLSVHPTYARFHLTNEKFINPQEPPMFCMVLRKHLTGAFIEKIEQIDLERIVVFTLESRNEIGDVTKKQLIIELMGKHSNIILIDTDRNLIIDSIKHVGMSQNRYRMILPGQSYIAPPSQEKEDLLTISDNEFISKLDFNQGKLDMQIVHTLTGISPFAAKEIVRRSNLGEISSYKRAFLEIQQEILNKDFLPYIFNEPKEDYHVLKTSISNEFDQTFNSTHEMLDEFYTGKAERDRVKQQGKDLFRIIKNEKDKNERKLKKHTQTLEKALEKNKYQKQGELLTAHLHLIKPGDKSVTVIDYYEPEAPTLTIELDPTKPANIQAQNFFKRYQKMKNSEVIVSKEIRKTKVEISYLEQLLQQIEVAHVEDITDIREELIEEGYLKRKTKHKKKKNKRTKPIPEQFISTDGTIMLVGKNNKQNEYVTTKLANRNDYWLHTKNIPGSHVVIRSENPNEETLFEAAQLAAYYSKSQNSSSVSVDYTLVRHVKKPNGAKPGFVIYDNQKTITVTPDANLISNMRKRKAE